MVRSDQQAHSSFPMNRSVGGFPERSYATSREFRTAASYNFGRVLGNGSFGVVCEARCLETGEQVAIKKVLQDPRYKNRELDVMKELDHPNVVTLKDYFYTEVPASSNDGEQRESQRFLNVAMDYVPDTVYRVMKMYTRNNQPLPPILVRLYTYQMCRGLGYLHSLGVCHRDIKPQNLLVDSRSHVLKLCDFGSAKRLCPGEPSVSYICSRFYRAPELMLGATDYTTAIDIWSVGCVLGELLLGKPLFAGDTSVDQLVKIIQVLGTPTREQMKAMNPSYTEFRFPDVPVKRWRSVFMTMPNGGSHVTDDGIDLLQKLLVYEPMQRLTAFEALAHPFFDPLRQPGCRSPEGNHLPLLFNFSESELNSISEKTRSTIVPEQYSSQQYLPQLSSAQQVHQISQAPISSVVSAKNDSARRESFTSVQTSLFQQLQVQSDVSNQRQAHNQQSWR